MIETVKRQIEHIEQQGFAPVRVVFQAIRTFASMGALEAAASLAYYTFFSVFPLLLLLISVGGAALTAEAVEDQLFRLTNQLIPVSQTFIKNTIDQVLEQRGTVSIVGILGLAWSASGAFNVMVKHINLAWPNAEPRGTFHRRLYSLGIVFLLAVLLLLWLTSSALLDLIPRLIDLDGPPEEMFRTARWRIFSNLLPLLLTTLMFYGLYRLVPNQKVSWSVAFWGAFVAAVGWELAAALFNWYLSSGLANFSLVYGSLGAIVSFLLWIYISGVIVLFGAHLSAAVEHVRNSEAG